MDDRLPTALENTNLQENSRASHVQKMNILALIAGITSIATIIFISTLSSDTPGFSPTLLVPVLLLLISSLILAIWGLSIIILAIKAKINSRFSSSGIKVYHIILAILMLFPIPVSMIYDKITTQNYRENVHALKSIISGADQAKTEEEISKYYFEKMKEIKNRGWQTNLREKMAKKDNVPILVLEDIFNPLKNQIEKNECFDWAYIKVAEALIENIRTPDNILVQLTHLPLIPGYHYKRESVARKAANALTKIGYVCEPYESKEQEVCFLSDSKKEIHTPLDETFFRCTKMEN